MYAVGDRVRLTRQAHDEFDPSYPRTGTFIGLVWTRDGRLRFRLRMDPDRWGKCWELDFAYNEIEAARKAA